MKGPCYPNFPLNISISTVNFNQIWQKVVNSVNCYTHPIAHGTPKPLRFKVFRIAVKSCNTRTIYAVILTRARLKVLGLTHI